MMSSVTQTLSNQAPANIRALNLRRDLKDIADLVELCFAERLDVDGRRYLRQMRSAAQNPGMLGVAGSMVYSMHGFVWEEDQQLVGNLSLVPVVANGERAYLIANVAVHPDYRRRGIAKGLTEEALAYLRAKRIKGAWLQVDADNAAAHELYTNAGFREEAQRTTWHSQPIDQPVQASNQYRVTQRSRKDWPQQQAWLNHAYPKKLHWHLALKINMMRPGFSGTLNRLLSEKSIRQWTAYRGSEIVGVAAWQSSVSQADWLWLAASEANETDAIDALLPYVRNKLGGGRTLAINYPSGRAEEAFANHGFQPHQELIWMFSRLA